MFYVKKLKFEIGGIWLASDGEFLTALCFEDSKDFEKKFKEGKEENLPIFDETEKWLKIYFSGKQPNFVPKIKFENLSPFQSEVTDKLMKIPFGKTVTYGEIANQIEKKHGIKKMSAQAVGRAVGANKICIIVPCHRVVGANGNLTGYGGGMKNKIALLEVEGNDMSKFFVPEERKGKS